MSCDSNHSFDLNFPFPNLIDFFENSNTNNFSTTESSNIPNNSFTSYQSFESSTLPPTVEEPSVDSQTYIPFNVDNDKIPKIGMCFDTEKEAIDYYYNYAFQSGFGVTKKGGTDKCRSRVRLILKCSCEGNPRCTTNKAVQERRKLINKTGCKAMIYMVPKDKFAENSSWLYKKIILEHNHRLNPEYSHRLPCFRHVPDYIKRQIKKNEVAGLSVQQNIKSIMALAGGSEEACGFLEKDIRNEACKIRKSYTAKGDTKALLTYFEKQQTLDPRFFHRILFDDDDRPAMIFWSTSVQREAYRFFGDVVSFDSTYSTNKYKMPFAPFIGVNHHLQSINFGSAIILSETTESYQWVFKSFLDCMDNVHPKAIVTDQARSISQAVKTVMPNCHHRLCLWHILKKIPSKIGKKRKRLNLEITNVVKSSTRTDEFEQRWKTMIKTYKVEENNWLTCMYKLRKKWVPAYLRDTFWAKMLSSQRSESINSFLKNYVNMKLNLSSLAERIDEATSRLFTRESIETNRCTKSVKLIYNTEIEKQFHTEYTVEAFGIVQHQLTSVALLNSKLESISPTEKTYNVYSTLLKRTYEVIYNFTDQTINCECKMFQTDGILCSHCFAVFREEEIGLVPTKYVLDRWSKNFERYALKKNPTLVGPLAQRNGRDDIYGNLHPIFVELVEYVKDPENYKIIKHGLFELRNKMSTDDNKKEDPPINEINEPTEVQYKDPIVKNNCLGRPKRGREKSTQDKICEKIKKSNNKKKSNKKDKESSLIL